MKLGPAIVALKKSRETVKILTQKQFPNRNGQQTRKMAACSEAHCAVTLRCRIDACTYIYTVYILYVCTRVAHFVLYVCVRKSDRVNLSEYFLHNVILCTFVVFYAQCNL